MSWPGDRPGEMLLGDREAVVEPVDPPEHDRVGAADPHLGEDAVLVEVAAIGGRPIDRNIAA